MAEKLHNKKKTSGAFTKVLLAVVLPLVFLITLAIIVLTLLGINVFEKAEQYARTIPGISQSASSEESNTNQAEQGRMEAVIANKDAEIEEMQMEINQKQSTIDELEQKILQLETDLEDTLNGEDKDGDEKAMDVAESFQEMDAEEAALIMENMNQSMAVQVLTYVGSKERGEILGQMNPEVAAGIAAVLLEK